MDFVKLFLFQNKGFIKCFQLHFLQMFLNLLSELIVLDLKMSIWMIVQVSARSLKCHLYL